MQSTDPTEIFSIAHLESSTRTSFSPGSKEVLEVRHHINGYAANIAVPCQSQKTHTQDKFPWQLRSLSSN